MDKKALDFTFSWMFAIIAGATILVIAIYATTQLISTGKTEKDTFVAGELANILSPVETNLEDNKYSAIEFSSETRVYNECSEAGAFGVQRLSTASQSSRGQWSDQSIRKSVYNKYIFSRAVEQSENERLNVMVNPIYSPFKLGDAIIIYSGKYCFVNSPSDIEDLILGLSADGKNDIGINITNNPNSCPLNFTKVCFNKLGCDINVETTSKVVTKSGKSAYYDGDSLMLAAILSDNEIYECQLKRLMKRAGELAVAYKKKADFIEGSGCSNNLGAELQNLILYTNISSSRDFARTIAPLAKDLERRNNELASCKIF